VNEVRLGRKKRAFADGLRWAVPRLSPPTSFDDVVVRDCVGPAEILTMGRRMMVDFSTIFEYMYTLHHVGHVPASMYTQRPIFSVCDDLGRS
jgi:hypothetical protein